MANNFWERSYQHTVYGDNSGVNNLVDKAMIKAIVNKNGATVFSKYFNSEIEAAVAYNEAAAKYFGEFAKLNNIQNGGC